MKSFLLKMLGLLTSVYNRKDYDAHQQLLPLETSIGKMFSIFAWGLDSVQEQAEMIRLWDNLEYACGSVLDRYGANFGVKRVSPDDRFYRLAIRVKMMSLLSGGDTDTVIRAASALLDVDPSDVAFEDVFPAKTALYVDLELLSQDRRDLIEPIAYAIKRILAAGVGMRLYLRTYRTYRGSLTLLQCGYVSTQVSAVPISQDRESIKGWDVSYGGFTEAAFMSPPFSAGRTAAMPVLTAHGAVQTPAILSAPPEPQRAYTGRQERARGAVFHTHIKGKRID